MSTKQLQKAYRSVKLGLDDEPVFSKYKKSDAELPTSRSKSPSPSMSPSVGDCRQHREVSVPTKTSFVVVVM